MVPQEVAQNRAISRSARKLESAASSPLLWPCSFLFAQRSQQLPLDFSASLQRRAKGRKTSPSLPRAYLKPEQF